ncbi:MAG: VanZ family protein [Thermodesulfobacteriota bacterium]
MNLILTIFYMVIVFILSVVKAPGGEDPFRGFDKVLHFLAYGLMGLLWIRVLLARGYRGVGGGRQRGVVFKALLITFLYGLIIEFVQGLLPAREASIFDAIANGLGSAAGIALYYLLDRCIRLS